MYKNSGIVVHNEESQVVDLMEHLTLNLDGRLVREEQLDGEDYLVVPSVAMTEGIHNGSRGKLFYSAEELKKWSPSWNHKPLVVNHPTDGSACTQEFLNSNKVGLALNMRWDGKQRFEAWFHKKKTEKCEPRIISALNEKKMMELSTGLIVDVMDKAGVFGSEKYDKMAVNHRPDHIAILPDSIGACSIKKGAGVLQLNELSHDELRSLIAQAINNKHAKDREKFPDLYAYVSSVFDDFCIYNIGGKLFEVRYKVNSDEVALVGSPTEVERKVSYIPVKNTGEENEDMAKKDMIDALIKDGKQWKEEDRKALEAMNEDQLKKIEIPKFGFSTQNEMDAAVKKGVEESIVKNAEEDKKKKEKEEKEKKDRENPPANNQQISLEQLPAEIRAVYNFGANQIKQQKDMLIENICKAPGNIFTKENLATKPIEELQALNALAGGGTQQIQLYTQPNYAGLGMLPVTQNQNKEEAMGLPAYNEEKFRAPAVR